MKGGRDHRIPLCPEAIGLLRSLYTDGSDNVFIGAGGAPLGPMSLRRVLAQLGKATSVHGFRSSFRDWAAERTNYPNHVVEMALAHTIGNQVEAAYRRGDLFQKRRKLMEAWASYCSTPVASGDTIVPLGKRA
jgi:integrase